MGGSESAIPIWSLLKNIINRRYLHALLKYNISVFGDLKCKIELQDKQAYAHNNREAIVMSNVAS